MTDREKIRLVVAFIQGAKWWEYLKSGATMWPADEEQTEAEAWKRLNDGRLGEVLDLTKEENENRG